MYSNVDFDVVVVGGGPAGAVAALKCSLLGFNVVLLERDPSLSKPCSGLLTPSCQKTLYELLNVEFPSHIYSNPSTLKVCFFSPDSEDTCAIDYRLLNVKRNLLDAWLREYASKHGVKVWHKAEFVELMSIEPIKVLAKADGKYVEMNAEYLVGADGVYSKIRSQLFPNINFEIAPAIQEYWIGEGDFKDCFYVFLKGELTKAYAYLIPKDNLIVIGMWAPNESVSTLKARITLFKKLLKRRRFFKPLFLVKREIWAVPYQHTIEGARNVILVGDAAGFCNALTGEGIRYAVESASVAGESILEASAKGEEAVQIYREKIKSVTAFLNEMQKVAASLTDDDRRNFVDFLQRGRVNE